MVKHLRKCQFDADENIKEGKRWEFTEHRIFVHLNRSLNLVTIIIALIVIFIIVTIIIVLINFISKKLVVEDMLHMLTMHLNFSRIYTYAHHYHVVVFLPVAV